MSTPLARILRRRIAAVGPISLADYMAECLLHPEHGYYSTRDPLGAAGDFTTAPEISQMFGELLGLALAQAWLDQGAPARFALAELGPGRGTLMADLLRATAAVPGFREAAEIHLVEASPSLRARQRETLAPHTPGSIRWHETAAGLPDLPLFLIANEFFDALPIRQFRREAGPNWRECQVALDGTGQLALGLSAPSAHGSLAHRLEDTRPGDIVETRAPADSIMAEIERRIARHGGAALIVDYGNWRSLGDTLQALRGHRPEHVLAHPGEADLTAHVDFEALRRAAPALSAPALTDQGALLRNLGIALRAARLAKSLSGEALKQHLAAAKRLTDPEEMGTLFKALALHPPRTPPPPGFGT